MVSPHQVCHKTADRLGGTQEGYAEPPFAGFSLNGIYHPAFKLDVLALMIGKGQPNGTGDRVAEKLDGDSSLADIDDMASIRVKRFSFRVFRGARNRDRDSYSGMLPFLNSRFAVATLGRGRVDPGAFSGLSFLAACRRRERGEKISALCALYLGTFQPQEAFLQVELFETAPAFNDHRTMVLPRPNSVQ